MFPFFFKNISYMVAFSTQLVLKKYYVIYKRPKSTFAVFCQFCTCFFFLGYNYHPYIILLCLKEPALYLAQQTIFFHRPLLLAQDSIVGISRDTADDMNLTPRI